MPADCSAKSSADPAIRHVLRSAVRQLVGCRRSCLCAAVQRRLPLRRGGMTAMGQLLALAVSGTTYAIPPITAYRGTDREWRRAEFSSFRRVTFCPGPGPTEPADPPQNLLSRLRTLVKGLASGQYRLALAASLSHPDANSAWRTALQDGTGGDRSAISFNPARDRWAGIARCLPADMKTRDYCERCRCENAGVIATGTAPAYDPHSAQ